MTASAQSIVPSLGRLHRFTVQEYHRMIATGILTEDSNVELLEGRIVQKMSHNPPHELLGQNRGEIPVREIVGAIGS